MKNATCSCKWKSMWGMKKWEMTNEKWKIEMKMKMYMKMKTGMIINMKSKIKENETEK